MNEWMNELAKNNHVGTIKHKNVPTKAPVTEITISTEMKKSGEWINEWMSEWMNE